MDYLFPFLALTIVGMLLPAISLRTQGKFYWVLVVLSGLLLIPDCILVGWMAILGGLGAVIGFFYGLILTVFALICAIGLAIFLPGRRKIAPLVITAVLPVMMLVSLHFGDSNSWESQTMANGNLISQALGQYHVDHDVYPNALDALVPKYLTDLREPSIRSGWLYQTTGQEFSLGFVYDVGSSDIGGIYLYQSTHPEWELNAGGPFRLEPTTFQ
jgi:hypothetical protein